MDTITTIPSLLTFSGSAQPVMVALTPKDSRLIAAAPDLLEMLRVVERYFDTEEPHPILQADISAAIAKATGAQP